jgi:hypothetical protein
MHVSWRETWARRSSSASQQRISRIQTGEVQHQARFAGGSWEDITPEMLVLYERLLENQTFLAEDLRGRLSSGDS